MDSGIDSAFMKSIPEIDASLSVIKKAAFGRLLKNV